MGYVRFHGIPWNHRDNTELHGVTWCHREFCRVTGVSWISQCQGSSQGVTGCVIQSQEVIGSQGVTGCVTQSQEVTGSPMESQLTHDSRKIIRVLYRKTIVMTYRNRPIFCDIRTNMNYGIDSVLSNVTT